MFLPHNEVFIKTDEILHRNENFHQPISSLSKEIFFNYENSHDCIGEKITYRNIRHEFNYVFFSFINISFGEKLSGNGTTSN